jgi:hypothetical protein
MGYNSPSVAGNFAPSPRLASKKDPNKSKGHKQKSTSSSSSSSSNTSTPPSFQVQHASLHPTAPQQQQLGEKVRDPGRVQYFSSLSREGVIQWLESLESSTFPGDAVKLLVEKFQYNHITGNVMIDLSEKDLEDMGIDKLGARRLFSMRLEAALCL